MAVYPSRQIVLPVNLIGTVWLYEYGQDGTFVVPKTGKYLVEIFGGGGGGAASYYLGSPPSAAVASGGSAHQKYTLMLTEGDSYAVTVGKGGTKDNIQDSTIHCHGGEGGTTTFGAYSCAGGKGGSVVSDGNASVATGGSGSGNNGSDGNGKTLTYPEWDGSTSSDTITVGGYAGYGAGGSASSFVPSDSVGGTIARAEDGKNGAVRITYKGVA